MSAPHLKADPRLSPARALQPENSAMLGLCYGCSSLLGAQCETFQKVTEQCAYLRYRLLVPHGRLLDQVADFYIPISTRNDHPGPPETHRHFHFSAAATLIPIRRKARRSDEKHPRCGKVKKLFPGCGDGFVGDVVPSTCVLRGETTEQPRVDPGAGLGGVLLRRIDSLKKLPNKKPLRAAGAHDSSDCATLRAHVGAGTDTVSKQQAAENQLVRAHVTESCEIHRLLLLFSCVTPTRLVTSQMYLGLYFTVLTSSQGSVSVMLQMTIKVFDNR